jgi:hypothetical protein
MLVPLLGLLSPPVPSVTVRFAALPMPEALARLSTATGRKLEAAPVLREEVLLARMKAVPVDEALRRVAESIEAEWVPKPDGTLILKPDPVQRRKSQAKREAANLENVRGSLAYLARRLGKQPATLSLADVQAIEQKRQREDAARKRAEEAQDWRRAFTPSEAAEETPAWRALARIVPLLGEKTLLAIPNERRAVWAERPTRMQHAFPTAVGGILAQYRNELALAKPTVEVARVRVVVQRWELEARYSSQLQAIGADGTVVDESGARLANDSDVIRTPEGHARKVPPANGEAPLTFSPESTEYYSLMSTSLSVDGAARQRLRTKWMPILLDPVKYEPLSWLPGEAFVLAAEAVDRNLVGTLSDLTGIRYDDAKPETATQFLARSGYPVPADPKAWIVLTPPVDVERVPRAKGMALLRDSVRNGGVRIDAAAEYAATSADRWPFLTWVGDGLSAIFPGFGAVTARAATNDELGIRLWHALGDGNRRALRTGKPVRVEALPPQALEIVNMQVYDQLGIAGGEPTETMPNGLPGGELRLSLTETPVFAAWEARRGETAEPVVMTPESLGRGMAKGIRYWSLTAADVQSWNRFRMGLRRNYRLTFDFGAGRTLEQTLDEVFLDPNKEPLRKLPAAVIREAEAARQKALTEPAKPEPTQTSPPPP